MKIRGEGEKGMLSKRMACQEREGRGMKGDDELHRKGENEYKEGWSGEER